jgi:ubiquinone/menaquinone biosynthesis C-methylase UbiE
MVMRGRDVMALNILSKECLDGKVVDGCVGLRFRNDVATTAGLHDTIWSIFPQTKTISTQDLSMNEAATVKVPTVRDRYNAEVIHFPATRLPAMLKDNLRPGPLALADLGCGDGRWFKVLEQGGYIGRAEPVYAVDIEGFRLARVSRRFPYIQVITSSADEVLQIPSGSLDFVISTDVLEHVSDEKRFLGEIRRVLKPDSKAYVSTVFKRRWAWYFRRRNGECVLDTSHVREYTDLGLLRGAIADSGLHLLQIETTVMWFPVVDPIVFRFLRKDWASKSRIVRLLRIIRVPIPGYYHLECVLSR